jgi:hypothetical protein
MEGCENRTCLAAGPYNPELTSGAPFTDGTFEIPPAANAYYYCRFPVITLAPKNNFQTIIEVSLFCFLLILYPNLFARAPLVLFIEMYPQCRLVTSGPKRERRIFLLSFRLVEAGSRAVSNRGATSCTRICFAQR